MSFDMKFRENDVFSMNILSESKKVEDIMDDYYREVNNVIQYLEGKEAEDLIGKTSKDLFNDYAFWGSNQNQHNT